MEMSASKRTKVYCFLYTLTELSDGGVLDLDLHCPTERTLSFDVNTFNGCLFPVKS